MSPDNFSPIPTARHDFTTRPANDTASTAQHRKAGDDLWINKAPPRCAAVLITLPRVRKAWWRRVWCAIWRW